MDSPVIGFRGVNRKSDADYATTIVTTDTTRPNVASTDTETASHVTHSEGKVVTTSAGLLSETSETHTSSDTFTQTDDGSSFDHSTRTSTQVVTDTNETGLIVNSNATASSTRNYDGAYTSKLTDSTETLELLTTKKYSYTGGESGKLVAQDSSSSESHTVDRTVPGLAVSTDVTAKYLSDRPEGKYESSFDNESQTVPPTGPMSSDHSEKHETGDSTVTSETHTKVTIDNTQTPITIHATVQTDETYSGGGKVTSDSAADGLTVNGAYTSSSSSDTLGDDTGKTTYDSKSKTTAWGVETVSTGVTQRQGSEEAPNTDEYDESRTGQSHSVDLAHQETGLSGGTVTSSSWHLKTWEDKGNTSWTQALHNMTEVTDASKASVVNTQKNTTDITDSHGSGTYSNTTSSRQDSFADGTWSSEDSGIDTISDGVSHTEKTTDTESHFVDTSTLNVERKSDTTSHTGETEDTSRSTESGYGHTRACDGATSYMNYDHEEIAGHLDEGKAGTSASTYHSVATTTYSTLELTGGYKYLDEMDQPASLRIAHTVDGAETVVEDRTENGVYTLNSTSDSRTENGTPTSSTYYHRVDTAGYTSDSKTNLPDGAVDPGIVVTDSVAAPAWDPNTKIFESASTLKHTEHVYTVQDDDGNDPTVTHETLRMSELLADGSWTRYDYDKTEESGKTAAVSDTKRTGTAYEAISLYRKAYRETIQDDTTSHAESTDSFHNTMEAENELASDGTTTSHTSDVEHTDSTTTSHSTVDTISHFQDKELDSNHFWLNITSNFTRKNTSDVTGGTASSDSAHVTDAASDGTVTDTLTSTTKHNSPVSDTVNELTDNKKERKFPTNRLEDWSTTTSHVASDSGVDQAEDHLDPVEGGGTKWWGSSEYSVSGSYTDTTESTHHLKYTNKTFVTNERIGRATSENTATTKETTQAKGDADSFASHSLATTYERTSDGKYTNTSTDTTHDKSTTDGISTETTDSTSRGSMGTNANIAFTGSTAASSTTNTHAKRNDTTTTAKTETRDGWTQTVRQVSDDQGTSDWTISSDDEVHGKNSNTQEFCDTVDLSSDNGSGSYSVSSDWTDKSSDTSPASRTGSGTSHAESNGTASSDHTESKRRVSDTDADSLGGVTERSGGTKNVDRTDRTYSTAGDVTRTVDESGVEAYSGSVTSRDVTRHTVSGLHLIREDYALESTGENNFFTHSVKEDCYGTSTVVDKDLTLTSMLQADGTTADTSHDTTTTHTLATASQYSSLDSREGWFFWPDYVTTYHVRTETSYGSGTYVTTADGVETGKGSSAMVSRTRHYYENVQNLSYVRDLTTAAKAEKKVPDGSPLADASLTATIDSSVDAQTDYATTYTADLALTGTQDAGNSSLWDFVPPDANTAAVTSLRLTEAGHSPTGDTSTHLDESPFTGNLGQGPYYDILTTAFAKDPLTWGGYPNLLEHTIGEQIVEWTFHTTGVDLIQAEAQAIEDMEIFADGVFGAVDGFLDVINPVNKWWSVPDVGVVFGHQTAYAVGQVVGTVAGVAVGIAVGNAAAGACGMVALAAKAYTFADAAAGMVGAAQNIYETGHVELFDALAFVPALTYGVQAFRGVRNQCFAAGTDVLAGSADDPSAMVGKKIEELQVGDLVWTRPADGAPDAPLVLKPVTAVYVNTAYELVKLSVTDANGNVEELSVTTQHPFNSINRGWTPAVDLQVGEDILSADGRVLHVTANALEEHPEGVATYNFEVQDGHTYFVADGQGQESWAWVHNTCDMSKVVLLARSPNP